VGPSKWLSKAANAVQSQRPGTWAVVVGAVFLLPFVVGMLADLLSLYVSVGVGVVAVLSLSLGVALLLSQRKATPGGRKPRPYPFRSRRKLITGWILVVSSAVVILVVFVVKQAILATPQLSAQPTQSSAPPGSSASQKPCPPPSALQGTIDEPPDNSLVDQTVAAHGKINGFCSGHQLILLNSYDGQRYFPERMEVAVADNRWRGTIEVGGAQDKGKSFVLELADIGPRGVIALDKYYVDESTRPSPVGIPSRAELLDVYDATFVPKAVSHVSRRR